MHRSLALSTLCAAALALPLAHAQSGSTTAPVKTAKAAPVKAAKKASPARQERTAAAAAAGTSETIALTPQQLDIATRVFVGKADCEFSQQVDIQPAEGKPGHFRVSYKNTHYEMVPEETSTGAIRLQDKRSGMMWLQIPSKSMLMNTKLGQRAVDSCMVAAQRITNDAPGKPQIMLGKVDGAR